MEITFEEDYLRELYYEGKAHNKKYRFQSQIIKKYVKVPLIYQIGNCVFRQIPLVMVMYTVMAIALLPFIYKSFRRYGNK